MFLARLNWETFASAAMFPQQCFLVKPGPKNGCVGDYGHGHAVPLSWHAFEFAALTFIRLFKDFLCLSCSFQSKSVQGLINLNNTNQENKSSPYIKDLLSNQLLIILSCSSTQSFLFIPKVSCSALSSCCTYFMELAAINYKNK